MCSEQAKRTAALEDYQMGEIIGSIFGVLIALLAVWFIIWLYILLPSDMASSRGRNAFAWVLVSIFFSPILAIFLLWILGDA